MLTGFLICAHIWDEHLDGWSTATQRWTRRGQALIPVGLETGEFSASRLFAALYPEAVDLAQMIAALAWRTLAGGAADQQHRFATEIGRRLGWPGYQPPENGDAIAHWMKYDSWRPPSDPDVLFPNTRHHESSQPARVNPRSLDRQHRGSVFFAVNRRGGGTVLHHRHIRPVLIRDWSRPMDGITATIWASRTTGHPVEDHTDVGARTIYSL